MAFGRLIGRISAIGASQCETSVMHRRLGHTTIRVTSVGVILAVLVACGGDDRPNPTTWLAVWESRQALVPPAETIVEDGQDVCGERLGVFRTELPALLPTPAEELDPAVEDWIAHAETIVFECPTDPADLDDRFLILDVLAAEVDAGLDAERGG